MRPRGVIPIKLGEDCQIRCAWVRGDLLGRKGIIHRARPGLVGIRVEIIIGARFVFVIIIIIVFSFAPFVDPCGFYFSARGRTSHVS